MVTNITFSGNNNSDVEEGVSTITGSFGRNFAVRIKKVTNKKPKSTIGVISKLGALFGILTFGIINGLKSFL
jgi:predicted SpoU family rRNA methylase